MIKDLFNWNILKRINTSILKKHLFIPYKEKDNFLFVAICQYSNKDAITYILKTYCYPHTIKFTLIDENILSKILTNISTEDNIQNNIILNSVEENSNNKAQFPIDAQEQLGKFLKEKDLISDNDLMKVLTETNHNQQIDINSTLFQMGLNSLEQKKQKLKDQTGMNFVTIDELLNQKQYVQLLDSDFVRKYKVIPISIDEKNIIIGVVKPLSQNVINKIIYITGLIPKQLLITDFEFEISYNIFFDTNNPIIIDYDYDYINKESFSNDIYIKYKTCENCQKEWNDLEYKYCPHCGNKLLNDKITKSYNHNFYNDLTYKVCACCHKELKDISFPYIITLLNRIPQFIHELNDISFSYMITITCKYKDYKKTRTFKVCEDCISFCNNCGGFIPSKDLINFIYSQVDYLGVFIGLGKLESYTIYCNGLDGTIKWKMCTCQHPKPSHNNYMLLPEDIRKKIKMARENYSEQVISRRQEDTKDIYLSNILNLKRKYCDKCQIILSNDFNYCPYCKSKTINISDVTLEDVWIKESSISNKCVLCGKDTKIKIKLIGGEKLDRYGRQSFCTCEIYLCDTCIEKCPKCGKILLTKTIENFLKNKANNCDKNKCVTCISLAFCNGVHDENSQPPQNIVPIPSNSHNIYYEGETYKKNEPQEVFTQELETKPFYSKILLSIMYLGMPLNIIGILCGIISFIWLCLIGKIINYIPFILLYFILLVHIIGFVLGALYTIPQSVCIKLFKQRGIKKQLGFLVLYLSSFIQSALIIITSSQIINILYKQKLPPLLTVILFYFIMALIFCQTPIINTIIMASFLIAIILEIIFRADIFHVIMFLFSMIFILHLYMNYGLAQAIINEQDK